MNGNTNFDLKLIISIVSCIVSIMAALFAWYQANKANKINLGQTEINVRNLIIERKKALNNFILNNTDDAHNEINKKMLNYLIEEKLNAYEEACSKYLDGKLDKKRFEKNYKKEIENLLQDKNMNSFILPEITSQYCCILDVYKKIIKN